MIVLFTDFGLNGPYVGQLHARLAMQAPGVPVIDLFHDVPNHDIRTAAYLLPAYTRVFPPDTVFVCVIDPGVGSSRRAIMVHADQHWFVGPDNGLFHILARRAAQQESFEIRWHPPSLASSFHGRDLFAPVAAQLALGKIPDHTPVTLAAPVPDWPEDLHQVLYIDRFGNALTGLRATSIALAEKLKINGQHVAYARVFHEVPPGQGFWYENANGLVEIAVNRGRACDSYGLAPGTEFEVTRD